MTENRRQRTKNRGQKFSVIRHPLSVLCLVVFALIFVQEAMPAAPPSGEVSPSAAPTADVNDSALTIASVRVEGNVSVKESEILAKVRSRAGDTFDAGIATEDTKRIAELKGVEYCYYNTKPVDGKAELTFVVVEKNLVRSIEFKGNKAYSEKKLKEKLGFKVGDYLDVVLAQTYTSTIAEFYRKNGFTYVEVSLDTAKASAGKVVYTVKEGPRVKITSVKFSGNSALKTGELKKTIKTSTRNWVIFSKYYQEDRLNEDLTKLQKVYQRKGFLNAKIEAKREFNAEKTKLRVTFVIEEGPAYSVDAIVFSGNEYFDGGKLIEQMKLQKEQTYNEQLAESDAKKITKLYHETGFIDAQVERSIKFVSPTTVEAQYTIKEGERFRIGQIIVTGNELTKDKVVRRILDEYDFQPGKWYNGDLARGDGKGELEKILQRMLITERDGATVTPAPAGAGQKDAKVSIIEGKTGIVMLGAGVSSDAGVIGQLIFEQRNFDISDTPKSLADFISGKSFRGGGQTLRITLEPGTEISEYSVSFTEPYLNDKPVSLDVSGSSWERYRESYDEARTKGFVGLEKRFKDKWRHGIGARAENVEVKDVEEHAPVEINDVAGNNFLTGIRLSAGRDLTDSRFTPSEGHNYEFSYEQVTGDFTFGIISGVVRKYYTLSEDLAERKTILAAKLLGATTVGDAPPFEKFYAGGTGYYGIRGFRYRGVSTRGLETGVANPRREDPIGSDWIFLASTEAAVPVISENFAWLFYVDSGAIDTGGYRVGVGTGIQIMIPQWFGPVPMRFEFTAPVMKEKDDDTQVFSFSIGTLF